MSVYCFVFTHTTLGLKSLVEVCEELELKEERQKFSVLLRQIEQGKRAGSSKDGSFFFVLGSKL